MKLHFTSNCNLFEEFYPEIAEQVYIKGFEQFVTDLNHSIATNDVCSVIVDRPSNDSMFFLTVDSIYFKNQKITISDITTAG